MDCNGQWRCAVLRTACARPTSLRGAARGELFNLIPNLRFQIRNLQFEICLPDPSCQVRPPPVVLPGAWPSWRHSGSTTGSKAIRASKGGAQPGRRPQTSPYTTFPNAGSTRSRAGSESSRRPGQTRTGGAHSMRAAWGKKTAASLASPAPPCAAGRSSAEGDAMSTLRHTTRRPCSI